MASRTLLRLLAALAVVGAAVACFDNQVHKLEPVSLAGRALLSDEPAGEVQLQNNFNYKASGYDWDKPSDPSWVCNTGRVQSPIDVPFKAGGFDPVTWRTRGGKTATTDFNFGKGEDVYVVNNGRTIQVEWLPLPGATASIATRGPGLLDKFTPAFVKSPMRRHKLAPAQFHFHTTSEHSVDQTIFPLEAHIVSRISKSTLPSCPDAGCLAVVGVVFQYGRKNAFLEEILDAAPRTVGKKAMPEDYVLDLARLFPKDLTYATFAGSLTTPPCAEGVLWHVLKTPVTVSPAQVDKIQNLLGGIVAPCELGTTVVGNCTVSGERTNNRPIQPARGRLVQVFKG